MLFYHSNRTVINTRREVLEVYLPITQGTDTLDYSSTWDLLSNKARVLFV